MRSVSTYLLGVLCVLFLVANLRNADWIEIVAVVLVVGVFLIDHPIAERLGVGFHWIAVSGMAMFGLYLAIVGSSVLASGGTVPGIGIAAIGLFLMSPLAKRIWSFWRNAHT